MRIFTWRDIEIEIERNKDKWPENWNYVTVYNDEIVVNHDAGADNPEEDGRFFRRIFARLYDGAHVSTEFDQIKLKITYEEGEAGDKAFTERKAPLFREIYLRKNKDGEYPVRKEEIPMIAFHSYKGGVGRTLSLISLARGIAEKYKDEKKILIIDSDLEAPGLTWMLNDEKKSAPVSYLDILSLLHFHNLNDELVDKTASLVKRSEILIETERIATQQYFIPVYREKVQMMDIFSTPEKIIRSQENPYIVTDYLFLLGKALKVDLILVDLRAGVTEYSAPFLFDPRVIKYYVTSTSMQSIMGMQTILNEIYQKTAADFLNSRIIMTMEPREMEESTKQRLADELLKNVEIETDDEDATFLREGYMTHLAFESQLISLGNFEQVCAALKGTKMAEAFSEIAEELLKETLDERELEEKEVRTTLEKLHEIATREITAEGSLSSNMLSTTSIREIVNNYTDTLPQIVVSGAKGSGKTYIYKQMLYSRSWNVFKRLIDGENEESPAEPEILFFPLLTSVNLQYLNGPAMECIKYLNTALKEEKADPRTANRNYNELMIYTEQDISLVEWTKNWINLIVKSIDKEYTSLSELDLYLEQKGKKIVFIVDGLEDLFSDLKTEDKRSWKYGLKAVCQNVINELKNLEYGNIGIIVFVRKDMVSEAIETNYEQFRSQYARYELNWSRTEALRLALWIASKANPVFSQGIDFMRSTREVLEERLELLWGKKLGKADSKEAFSSLWITAALSDFNGQLQARDIVRFLSYATINARDAKLIYKDRYIMPLDIRKAIPECSKDKLTDIKNEMKLTYEIFEKFINMEQKLLPLTLDKISLTGEEIAKLESQGYLKISDKKYYMPEIIRLGLGFIYQTGARPKVLSLLNQQGEKR